MSVRITEDGRRICNTCGEDQWFCEHSSVDPGWIPGVCIIITVLLLIFS